METKPEQAADEVDMAALAFRYLDCRLRDTQRNALNDRLRRDGAARSTFVRCLLQAVELEEFLPEEQATESLKSLTAVDVENCEPDQVGPELSDHTAAKSPKVTSGNPPSVGLSFLHGLISSDGGGIRSPFFVASLIAATMLSAGITFWAVKHASSSVADSKAPLEVAESNPSPPVQPRLNRAILVNVTNCRWDRTRSTADLASGGLEPGQSLHLLEGLAEIKSTLPSGGVGNFRLEGPLAMTLTDDGMPNVMFGKLSGEFSCRNDSFRLGTALGRIVVSGDGSLGVRAEANEIELHVFGGTANFDLWSTSPTGDPGQLLKVQAGTSLRVRMNSDRTVSIDHGKASENRFVTPATLSASQLNISDQYVKTIREAKPAAYWRFEREENDGLIRNEMSGRFALRMAGNAVRLRSSQNTRCAEFGIAPGPGYMMTDDVFDGVIKDDYTVELWAKPTCFHHGALFSLINWAPDINPKGRHRVYLEFGGPRQWDFQTPGGMWESDPGRLLFINGQSEPYSSAPYAVRKWQHLVALRERSNMKLYADGRLIITAKNSEKLGSGMRVLMGQLYPPSPYIRDDLTARLYSGELDEVAVYDRALNEAEIHKHLDLVKSGAEPRDPI
jgi:Concanavalin A-like lectin/glucanases superfamily